MLDEFDEDEEPKCPHCGAGLYTELHDLDCPRADEDTDDLEAED